jgi:ABC-type polysaccharide/polyol phosphate transport system ATPase subunit
MPRTPGSDGLAVDAKGLGIRYRRYREKVLSLKTAALSLFRGSNYEEFWALRGVDLQIPAGQSLGVIGPNGSGKSTLLKAIAGVLTPSEGQLQTQGRVAPMIELGAGFNDQLTGRENIYLNGAIMGLTRQQIEERVERMVEFADIGDFIDVPLRNYSSGMRARLGFAVTSDVDPDILLLDEVFSVGDEAFRRKSTARMEDFFDSGRTVVTVTHGLGLVQRLCTRVIYLRSGSLVADGPPDEVIARYREDVRASGGP